MQQPQLQILAYVFLAMLLGGGFVGAGSIIPTHRDGGPGETLTTESMLLAAAIGSSVALAQLVVALGLTTLILLVLRFLGCVENWFAEQPVPASPAKERP